MKKETGYWLFNCNPAIWDIKSRLQSKITKEDWGIPNNRVKQFKKGQLGFIRVALDTRPKRLVNKKLLSGFYALVEIVDEPFYGKTKNPKLFFKPTKYTQKVKNVELKTHWRVPINITESFLNSPILISDLKNTEFNFDKGVFQPGQGISVRPIERKSFFELLKMTGKKDKLWIEDIKEAFNSLGREASLKEIYSEVKKIRKNINLNQDWQAIVRREIGENSSDTKYWKKKSDLFYNVYGLGEGYWGLRSFANDPKIIKNYKKQFEKKVNNNLKLSAAELKKRANKSLKVKVKNTQTKYFNRDDYVEAYVKKIAKGKCDLCEKNAPFKKKKTNEPYLECHHVKWLSKGGKDIIENAVALCPNCHRKMHSLSLNKDIKKLFEKINTRQ